MIISRHRNLNPLEALNRRKFPEVGVCGGVIENRFTHYLLIQIWVTPGVLSPGWTRLPFPAARLYNLVAAAA